MTRALLIVLCASAGACSKAQPESTAERAVATSQPPTATPASLAVALATQEKPRAVAADSKCDELCEPVRRLKCRRAAECQESCRQMADVPLCEAELQQFYGCLAAQPLKHWECVDDGTGAIRQGVCEREQAGFAACLEKSDVH
jgi:hypothetical protein